MKLPGASTPSGALAERLKPAIRPIKHRVNSEPLTEIVQGCSHQLTEVAVNFLATVAEHSPYLMSLIRQAPQEALDLFGQPPERALQDIFSQSASACAASQSESDAMEVLRRMKRRAHLLIALTDIGGVWDVVEVTQAISAMADRAVSSALAFLLRQAASQGRIAITSIEDPEKQSGLVILALGKHGARELNYSSDVDLVVLYDPNSPVLGAGAEPAALFVRITRALVKILQERTGDGYVLRVDLRLRPDPGSTSVAVSLPAAHDYYEYLGQNWERAAFIKARPVAGELALGERFIKDLTPFIWRRYFDYAAIADIHAMKRQIHAVRGHSQIAVAGHDVKLGRGGIREVEFFVQTQQLVFGGRRPNLRGARTLDMLKELCRDEWIGEDALKDMSASYRFLRAIEHRLQMQNDEQTQRLPVDPEALERFARFCGYSGAATFSKALTKTLKAVERHYSRLFEHAAALDTSSGSLVFTGTDDDPETVETLRKMGFTDPSRAIETLRGWHFGRRPAIQSARAREVLTELVPSLIEAFAGSGDPDSAMTAFDMALTRMPAAIELFSILNSNPAMRELFADILGGAPRLADTIARRPHVLDAAIDPAVWKATMKGAAAGRMKMLIASNPPAEELLDAVRDIYQEESFLIGVRLLSGIIDASLAGHAYSDLAAAIIQACLKMVQRDFEADHGVIAGGVCAVFGMGKLGSREMTASSDLDLILLYDYDERQPDSQGRKPLHAAQYYARIAQRLISALTVSTRRGALYEVDMRLRPSGKQGPVATSLASFRDYQRTQAETWEHMALTRARFIAGDKQFGMQARRLIESFIICARPQENLAREVLHMRRLIAQEKGEENVWDLKLAAGGILDLEFLIQYFILAHRNYAVEMLACAANDPANIFNIMAREDHLSLAQAEVLAIAYRTFASFTQIVRLTTHEAFTPEKAASGVLRRIAAAMNLPDFRHVVGELEGLRRQVRKIFLEILEYQEPD